MNNEEINKKLGVLEGTKANLIQRKRDLEIEFAKTKSQFVQDKVNVDAEIIGVNTEIAQLRRQFKIKGYSTKKLRKLTEMEKQLIIEKKGSKCEECPSTKDLTVHHIKPLFHGGTNDMDNLKVLCLKCHRKYHRI